MSGRFISFEGGEGSGKSTQARLLAQALEARGVPCVLTREPGGTHGAEAIRGLLLHHDGPAWSPQAEALLFAAARADHLERRIRPALADGRWVISDRFLDSSRAYQGFAGGLGDEEVMALHRIGSGAQLPDLTVLLRLTAKAAAQRLAARDGATSDRISGRAATYHAAVAAAFERIAIAEPGRIIGIDGAGEIEEVHRRILAAVEARLAPWR